MSEAQGRVELGHCLRDLRVSRRWTLHDLAERVGLSISTLSAYEHGTRGVGLDELVVIGSAYDLLVTEVLAGVYPYGTRQEPPDRDQVSDARRRRSEP